MSLLDRSQMHHRSCAEFFNRWRGSGGQHRGGADGGHPSFGPHPGGREACLEFFLAWGALLVPSSLSTLQRCHVLLGKYADLPMDYADATLVVLAEELETDLVFTTDRRDFEVYRFGRDQPDGFLGQRLDLCRSYRRDGGLAGGPRGSALNPRCRRG